MKLIFLDVDGVLRPGSNGYKYSAECVENLNILTKETKAKIVVSSSWRGRYLKDTRRIFDSWGVEARIIGQTPRLFHVSIHSLSIVSRGAEIVAWLDMASKRRRPIVPEAIVVLDDEDDMDGLEEPCLVKTDTRKGLTMNDVNKAINILRRRERGEVQELRNGKTERRDQEMLRGSR